VPIESVRKEGKQMAATEEKKFSKIVIKDEKGISYTLEFNARVVKNLERRGFKIDTDYPLTMVEDLFLGAFQMHHKGIDPERVKNIWKFQTRKDELLGALIKIYMMPLEDLMGEEKEEGETEENPTWETV
jgi:hypothetical protein